MRRSLAALAVLLLLVPSASLAEPPSPEDAKRAKSLSRDAAKLARRGEWGEAAKLLGDAEGLHPTWKYAFELAKGHAKNGGWVASWRALKRGATYGVPPAKARQHDKLLVEVESELSRSHALLQLEVIPEGATVKISGQEWLPPWTDWVDREQTILLVEHPSCVPLKVLWLHPVGGRHKRVIELEHQSKYGRLLVVGKPEGAKVRVEGELIGLLPKAHSKLLKPGLYTLLVDHSPDYLPYEKKVRVGAGLNNRTHVQLEESEGDFSKLMKTKKFWGWVSTGTGAAAIIAGAVLLSQAAGMVADVEDLNTQHTGNYDAYVKEYDDLTGSIPGTATAGYVTLGVGLALGATGAALLIVDALSDAPARSAQSPDRPRFQFSASPVGVGAQMRF